MQSTLDRERGFVDLMTELLTNSQAREEFLSDPCSVLANYQLTKDELTSIESLNHESIKQQAALLLNKRWNEVRKRIPRTIEQVDDSVYEVFLFYASHHWPEGHLRHIFDAIQFAEFLNANKMARPDKRELRDLRRILASFNS